MKINILSKWYGKKKFQSFFEKLFFISLRGMNYGNGSDFEKSGEKQVFEIINKHFENQEIILFDIGANKGLYTIALTENILPKYHIYSFEPTSHCSEILKTIEDDNVTIFNFGFSSVKGEAKINYDYEGSVWASIENSEYSRYDKKLSNTEIIKLNTIDDFIFENKIEKINFIKIDIEGHELEALKGAIKTLKNNNIEFIQFEFGLASLHANNKLKDFFDLLSNYDIYRILQDGVIKLTYHESFEIFLTTNYLAVNKTVKFGNK